MRDADFDPGQANFVSVDHDDGTVADQGHLTFGGALAELGAAVSPGDPIGLCGDTGNTGGIPHLHFCVALCIVLQPGICETEPVTFRNAEPNPSGLVAGRIYVAERY